MTTKSRGFRQGTRKKLSKKPYERSPITIFLQNFEEGQNVVIFQEPSSHRGMPFPRFKGKSGVVVGKRGNSYIVRIADGNKVKTIISRPEHLKAI